MSFPALFEHIGDSSQAVGACREFHGDRSVPVWFGFVLVHGGIFQLKIAV
jgi:hypothetical protein